jgi:hypothetical protein
MKNLFYSVAHSVSPRHKTKLLSVEITDAHDVALLRFNKTHSFGVYESTKGEILPATYVGEELPMETFFQYSDYQDLKVEIKDKDACLVSPGGFVSRRGREVAKMLNINPDAKSFRGIAMENMQIKKDLGIVYVTTSAYDPEKRELLPCP